MNWCRLPTAAAPFRRACRSLPAGRRFRPTSLETDLLKRLAYRMRVVHCLLQLLARREVGISVVADHERDALLRVGQDDGADERQPCDCNELRNRTLPLPRSTVPYHQYAESVKQPPGDRKGRCSRTPIWVMTSRTTPIK
jgi:hypothetical protein